MSDFIGKLLVNVMKGRDLDQKECTCVLNLDGQRFKTKPSFREATSTGPVWNQSFTFNVNKPFDSLEVELLSSTDQVIGYFTASILDVSNQVPAQTWFKLKKRTVQNMYVRGEILLQLQYKYLSVWDSLYKAVAAVKDKNFSTAFRLLSDNIERYPNEWHLYAYRSAANIALGKFEDALGDATKIIELNPTSGEGFFRVGVVYFKVEEYEKAEEYYKMGLKCDPGHELCRKAIENQKKNVLKQQVRKALSRGRQYFAKGEYDLAINYLNDAIGKNPKNSSYYVYRAIANLALKRNELAQADAMRVVAMTPNWPKLNPTKQGYLYKEGEVNIMMKKRWFILKEYFVFYYNSSKDLEPNGVILLGDYELGRRKKQFLRITTQKRVFELKSEMEEYEKAEEYYKMGLKCDPGHELCRKAIENQKKNVLKQQVRKALSRGRQYFAKGEYDLAINYLNDAIGKNPKNSSYYVYRAIANLALKRNELAQADAMRVVAMTPNWPKLNPTKQGYLYKEGEVNIMMKKRWFILKEYFVFYYNSSKDLEPNGVILLGDYELGRRKKQFLRITTQKRVFELKSETEEERDDWLRVLEKILNSKPRFVLPKIDEKEDQIFLDHNDPSRQSLVGIGAVFSTIGNAVENAVVSTVTAPHTLATTVGKKIANAFSSVTFDNVDMEGNLFKMGQLNKSWKKRYFIIKDKVMYYFDNNEENIRKTVANANSLSPQGHFPLEGSKVEYAQEKTKKEFSFEIIANNRSYLLSANTQQDVNRWIEAIQRAGGIFANQVEASNDVSFDEDGTVRTNESTPADSEPEPQPQQPQRKDDQNGQIGMRIIENYGDDDLHHQQSNKFRRDSGEMQSTSQFGRVVQEDDDDERHLSLDSSLDYPDAQSDRSRGRRSQNQRGGVSSSESRYFKKFGLNPPPAPINSAADDRSSQHSEHYYDSETEEPLMSDYGRSPPQKKKKKKCCTIV
eukprot:TRINITY_DN5882_c0_g1_i1.p1 TRINITY_DN5882_c0_g1~~TRINITY_DN5882_c0_g1_i1.p1  ORF type:complete len:962 (+),score=265.98 TRINITY_DN5882_c0_g1_i1:189-3074(+)